MINHIMRDIQKFSEIKQNQFNQLPDFFKVRVIAKTVIVAAAVGLTSGLIVGNMTAIILFTATAISVGSSVLNRLSNPEYAFDKALKEVFSKGVKEAKNDVKDFCKSAGRVFEDVVYNISDINKSKYEDVKKERFKEDIASKFQRFFSDIFDELKFTMAL